MNRSLISSAKKDLSNIPGWRTKRRLLVVESDDWGSIRMPSNEVFLSLQRNGINFSLDEGYRYNKNDSLATSDDLSNLFDLLSSLSDITGRSAVMTPVAVVANPDFEKIEQAGFNEYFFEPFTETLKKYPGCEKSFTYWKEGIENRLFVPQFHGREHLNVNVWIKALIAGHKKTRIAFNSRIWGFSTANDPEIGVEFQAAFDFVDSNDLLYHKEVLLTGLDLFERLLGYRATYFVPPNGPFSSRLEEVCAEKGIMFLSMPRIQTEPLGKGRTRKRIHWLGQKTGSGLTCITRNCFFEPGEPGRDWIDSCLSEISSAFKWNKPAVISSHRVNYIGALDINNRYNGLKELGLLLKTVIKNWPETEFVTSEELGEIIASD